MSLPRGILRWTDARDRASGNTPRFNLDASTIHQYDANQVQDENGAVEGRAAEVPTERKRIPRLKLATLNIIDARQARLNAALRCMSQMNIDLGILTETKLNTEKYTKLCAGYRLVATTADGRKGGVGLFYRESKHWSLESTKVFGPNVIRTTLVAGNKRWYIIGAYVLPSETDGRTLDFISEAESSVTNSNWPVILLGDFNVDLANPVGNSPEGAERRVKTAALIDTMGLVTQCNCFRSARKHRGWQYTWSRKRRDGVVLRSVTDHILTTPHVLSNCQTKTPRFDTDHKALVGTLRLVKPKYHQRYVRSRSVYPVQRLPALEQNRADAILEELEAEVEKQPKDPGRDNSWIAAGTWRLMDQRASARRNGDTEELKRIGRELRKALRTKDRADRAADAAARACNLLEGGKIRDAFGVLKGWYKEVGPRPHKPSREEIGLTRSEYENLYSAEEPQHPPIPIHIDPFAINDAPPEEEEVVAALKKLRNNRAAGATGINAELVKRWHEDAKEADNEGNPVNPDAVEIWEKVLELIRLAFEEGEVPRAFCHGILVLIPKSKPGEYRGIALLEIIYKLVSAIINNRLKESIKFDDAIHGFRAERGTSTAIMEAKLLAQLCSRSDEPLFMVFLDLKKAYDTLDRNQAMRILKGYGVGENLRRLLNAIWQGDTMVPRQAGYFGRPFRACRGVRQGDIVSPIIFNIMADAVVRHWRHTTAPEAPHETAVFYADDGLLTGRSADRVQDSIDVMTASFGSLGLRMNATKTEFMVMAGGRKKVNISRRAYNQKFTDGPTFRERNRQHVVCIHCGTEVNCASYKQHQRSQRCLRMRETYEPPTPVHMRHESEQSRTPVEEEAQTYHISIPRQHTETVCCPVDGCDWRVEPPKSLRRGLRLHFRQRHIAHTIIVTEEGLLPRCQHCRLFSSHAEKESHSSSLDCKKFSEKRRAHCQIIRQDMAKSVEFTVGGNTIKRVDRFKYLGRILDDDDDDVPAAMRQLARAKEKWRRFSAVLKQQGASARTRGFFYKAVIQAILLYRSESWTLLESTLRLFRSFHSRVARHLTSRHICCLEDGTWFCPPTAEILEAAGLRTIEEYIQKRRDTIREHVWTRPIYQECRRSKALQTNANKVVWWRLD